VNLAVVVVPHSHSRDDDETKVGVRPPIVCHVRNDIRGTQSDNAGKRVIWVEQRGFRWVHLGRRTRSCDESSYRGVCQPERFLYEVVNKYQRMVTAPRGTARAASDWVA